MRRVGSHSPKLPVRFAITVIVAFEVVVDPLESVTTQRYCLPFSAVVNEAVT
jgi:hypothetical protein